MVNYPEMKRILYATAILLLTGCIQSISLEEPVQTLNRFTVDIGEFPVTRAYLANGTEIEWDENDAIGVFSDTQDVEKYVYGGLDEKGNPFFIGNTVSGTTFYAFYPFDESVYDPENKEILHFSLPDAGENPAHRLPMIAKSTGAHFSFKQTCGILHLTVKGKRDFWGIGIMGNLKEAVRGEGTVNLSDDTPQFVLNNPNDTLPDNLENRYWYSEEVLSGEEPLDVYFVLPPMTFEKGFTACPSIRANYFWDNGERGMAYMYKSTPRTVTISRAAMKSFVIDFDAEELEMAGEREALVAFYKAMDGDHWKNNTNWCSDKPLNEWYGVGTTDITDLEHVAGLLLRNNNLRGSIPPVIAELPHLRYLDLGSNPLTGEIPDELYDCTLLESILLPGDGYIYQDGSNPGLSGTISPKIGNLVYLEELDLFDNSLTGEIPPEIGNLSRLRNLNLRLNSLTYLPPELFRLTALENLDLSRNNLEGSLTSDIGLDIGKLVHLTSLQLSGNRLSGSIPPSIGNLKSLTDFRAENNLLSGDIPEELYSCSELVWLSLKQNNLTGPISSKIGNLTKAQYIHLDQNQLEGNIPVEILSLPELKRFITKYNNLSGRIPAEFKDQPLWDKWWGCIIQDTGLSIDDARPKCPEFTMTLRDGSVFSSDNFADNELTAILATASWCPMSGGVILGQVWDVYKYFKDKGFEVLNWWLETEYDDGEGVGLARNFLDEYGIDWKTGFFNLGSYNGNTIGGDVNYPVDIDGVYAPGLTLVDQEGRVVYTSYIQGFELQSFLEEWFGEEMQEELYVSSDFSRDGNVIQVSSASVGNGIDLVFMGDGFSDRLIADGTYEAVMRQGIDALFSMEPFSSFYDLFNIFIVEAVSKNEGYHSGGETTFGASFPEGGGNPNTGDADKVLQYAAKAVPETRLEECTITVLMNDGGYGGVTSMYFQENDGDYGSGHAIAWLPLCSLGEDAFRMVLCHETGGHGFGKLADEYYPEEESATLSETVTEKIQNEQEFGWWRNIAFTSDPDAVSWSDFISDSRYDSEKIGVYEGGLAHYRYGVYRPTESSIMKSEPGPFNAPSREAIWYRIQKLAYGTDLDFSHEDFVEYDAVNRQTDSNTKALQAHSKYLLRPLPKLAPPVVIRESK